MAGYFILKSWFAMWLPCISFLRECERPRWLCLLIYLLLFLNACTVVFTDSLLNFRKMFSLIIHLLLTR